jgi:hypothetical protein
VGFSSVRVGVAGVAIVVFALSATWISLEAAKPEPAVPTSPQQAHELLDEAVRLVQADDYVGLCGTLGLYNACDVHLQMAQKTGLVPSKAKPEVVEVTQLGVDEVSLRLQGTYVDGRTYETEFHVFRSGEQLRASNVVYWLPVRRVQADCKFEPGRVECGMAGSSPPE